MNSYREFTVSFPILNFHSLYRTRIMILNDDDVRASGVIIRTEKISNTFRIYVYILYI